MQLPFVAGQETRIVRKQKPKPYIYAALGKKMSKKKKKTLNYTECFWNERWDATLKGCLGKEWRGVTRRKKKNVARFGNFTQISIFEKREKEEREIELVLSFFFFLITFNYHRIV